MEGRIIINSGNLQKLFAKEYENFFAANNLIVSVPQVITRGNVTHLKELKIRLGQKMPTKTYVGINIRKDGIINFKTVTRFVINEKKFITNTFELAAGKEFTDKVKETIKEKLLEGGFNQGLDITIFSENEKDTGVQTYSGLTLLVCSVIHILSGKLSPDELDNYDDFINLGKARELYMTTKDILEKISPIPKEHINMLPVFTTGINDTNICVGIESKEYIQSKYPKIKRIENNFGIKELNINPAKMVEYSIINFGGFFNEFYNTRTYLNVQEQFEKAFKKYKLEQSKGPACMGMINLLYIRMFQTTKEVLLYPNEDVYLETFFQRINRLGLYQSFLEKYIDLYQDITTTFKKNIIFKDEILGLLPISSSKQGGSFLCITKPEKSRETLKKTIEELHTMGYSTAKYQYLSREDGISEEHLRIEQYLDQGVFSSHIKKDDVLLGCGSKDHYGTKKIGNHRKLLEETKESIIFDCIDGKIHLNNEMTNHGEILTQSGTVEIIKVLFENMGEYVNNSKLPSSSYSKNKNEITGKIIGPLQELIQKKYNGKLDLECTGSIVDFDLKLTPNNINICLMKRIGLFIGTLAFINYFISVGILDAVGIFN